MPISLISIIIVFFNKASLTDSVKATRKLHENQARVEQLTKDWTEKWKEAQSIMQVGTKARGRDGTGGKRDGRI